MALPRRVAVLVATVPVLLVVTASPALADPAEPTNYQSTVLRMTPNTNVATFHVIGGDSFLQVTVAPGHTVEIPGYFDEPYLRIDTDGSVWLNENSPAAYINLDRYGESDIPEGVDGRGEPQWRQVATGGTYAWHDHRSHWMSPDLPPAVSGDERQVVFPWEVPVVIDGRDTVVEGELVWIPSKSPIPGILAGVIALLPLAFWQRDRGAVLAATAAAAALLAGAVILAEMLATPAEGRVFPVWVINAAVALAAASVGLLRSGRLSTRLALFAALVLSIWVVSSIDILWRPIVPSTLPEAAARGLTGTVLWASLGVAVLAVLDEVRSPRHAPDRQAPASG